MPEIVFIRALFSAIAITVLMLIINRNALKIKFKDCWVFIGTGIVGILGTSFTYFTTIELSSMSFACVMMYTAPIFVAVFSRIFFKEKFAVLKTICLIVTFIGCVLCCYEEGGLTAGKKLVAQKTAGVFRKILGNTVEGHMKKDCYEFCWIVDFPMYEMGEESGELEFCHNPFSMPQGGMKDLLEKEPLDILAYQYDLVCNGVELSSGAVRNHDPELMIKAFELVRLGEDDVKAKFPAMYNAFTYGAPPHAGIAPGVDRMVMLIAGEESIREIIPFPMNKTAMDVMMGAPSEVDPKQLADVHIKIDLPKEEK